MAAAACARTTSLVIRVIHWPYIWAQVAVQVETCVLEMTGGGDLHEGYLT